MRHGTGWPSPGWRWRPMGGASKWRATLAAPPASSGSPWVRRGRPRTRAR